MNSLLYAARPIVSDMLSTILFAGLFAATDNVYLATGAGVALGIGQVAYEKMRGKSVPGMQWASLGLVTVLGGATLLTGDPRFVMIKPTIIYLTIAAAMMQRGWLTRYIVDQGRALVSEKLVIFWGYAWAGLMALTAVANLAVALYCDHKTWLAFVGVFPLASKLAMFAATYGSIRYVAVRNRRRTLSAGETPIAQAA